MKQGKLFKLITAIGETVLAIPILGAILIVSSLWTILLIMLGLHIAALVFGAKEKRPLTGNIIGVVASVLGWIPFVGLALHIASAIFLWVEYTKMKN